MRERTVESDSSRFLERVIFCNSCRDCDRTTCEECKQQLQKADRKAVLKETLREYFSER